MSAVKELAQQLASIFEQIADLQNDARDILDAAAASGISVKALRKAAKELVMDSGKRAALYEDEDQLDMFRRDIGLKPSFARAAE